MVGLKCLNCSSQEWQEITRGARGAPIDIKGLLPPCSDRGLSVDKINHQINWPVRVARGLPVKGLLGQFFVSKFTEYFDEQPKNTFPRIQCRHDGMKNNTLVYMLLSIISLAASRISQLSIFCSYGTEMKVNSVGRHWCYYEVHLTTAQ